MYVAIATKTDFIKRIVSSPHEATKAQVPKSQNLRSVGILRTDTPRKNDMSRCRAPQIYMPVGSCGPTAP